MAALAFVTMKLGLVMAVQRNGYLGNELVAFDDGSNIRDAHPGIARNAAVAIVHQLNEQPTSSVEDNYYYNRLDGYFPTVFVHLDRMAAAIVSLADHYCRLLALICVFDYYLLSNWLVV